MNRDSFVRVSCLIVGSTLAISAPAPGQEPVRARSAFVPHVSVAGALDLRNSWSRYPSMYMGLAGLEWPTGISGLGLSIEGLYARRGQDIRVFPQDCGPACEPGISTFSNSWSQVSATGGFVGATYELMRRRRFRPHVMASVGAVQTNDRAIRQTKIVCPSCLASADYITTPTRVNDRTLTGASGLGAGATYSWRWVSVVADARYIAVANGIARGLNGAFPFALGLRF